MVSIAFVINFLDRQVLSVLAPTIRHELSLSQTQYGVIVFSFLLGMALFQIPNGMLMDRAGPRQGFTIIVSAWSVASGVRAAAQSALAFCSLRFALGAAECGNYTGGLKLVAQSFPTRERGLAGGIFNSCTFIGSVVAPILVPWLAIRYSWRAAFVVVSSTGLVWVVVWRFLYPRSLDSQVADENRVKAPGASVRALLKHRQTWGLILLRSLTGPLSQFYWFWLPEYLSTARGLSLEQLGRVVWIPYFCAGLGNVFSGALTGWLQKRGRSVDFSRRLPLFRGALITTAANLCVYAAPTVEAAVALLAIANFGANMIRREHDRAELHRLLRRLLPQGGGRPRHLPHRGWRQPHQHAIDVEHRDRAGSVFVFSGLCGRRCDSVVDDRMRRVHFGPCPAR